MRGNFLKKLKTKEVPLLLFFILIFILIRSIHFPERLDFATDQATSSSAVLQIVRDKHPILIGPRFTLEYKARYMFFGPLPYYFQTPFMVLGNFDPIVSSYLFMLFAGLMIIPLYIGTKCLTNQKTAIMFVIIYTLLPFFVSYSGFLWNPNFQFVLLPVVVLLMGLFKKYKSFKNLFFLSLFLGMLLEFHFVFLFIILGEIVYYFFIQRLGVKYLMVFLSGIVLGLSPLILFDLRNDFYETRTVLIFIQHWREVLPPPGQVSSGDPHYFLSFVFFLILILLAYFKRFFNSKILVVVFLLLLGWSLILFLPKPSHAYGMVDNWNYLYEEKAFKIIKQQNLTNFNVVNLGYDTIAEVQKYLLKKDNIKINYYDYWYNDYLFVITNKPNFLNDPAYEVKNINPAKLINSWEINSSFKLYLVEKVK